MSAGAPSRHGTAFLVLAACTATTGASFVLFKASVLIQAPLAVGESTWFIAAHNLVPRFFLGAALLVAIHGISTLRLTRAEWLQAAFMATVSFAGCLLQTDGLQRTSAAATAFLTQFYVILIPVWWAMYRRRWPAWPVWAAALMVMVGVGLIARVDWTTLRLGRGESEILLATVFFSVLICALNWGPFAANRPERTSTMMFVIEGALFAAVAIATCRESTHLTAPYRSAGWIVVAILATILGTAGPFVLMNRWQRYLTPAEAGLLYSFGPVVAALAESVIPRLIAPWLGIDYPSQPLTSALVAGGALVLGANALIHVMSAPEPESRAGSDVLEFPVAEKR